MKKILRKMMDLKKKTGFAPPLKQFLNMPLLPDYTVAQEGAHPTKTPATHLFFIWFVN